MGRSLRDVARVPQQGVAQRRHEHPGAAHLGQRAGQDVAVGADVDEFHREPADGSQLVRGLLGLGEGELAGPGADPNCHCGAWPAAVVAAAAGAPAG